MSKLKETLPQERKPLYSRKAQNAVCGTGMTVTVLLVIGIFITHGNGPQEAFYATVSWAIFMAFVTFLAWCIFTIVEITELRESISDPKNPGPFSHTVR